VKLARQIDRSGPLPGYDPATLPGDRGQGPVEASAPRPNPYGTVVFLLGVLVTSLTLDGNLATDYARHAAIGFGISLAASFAIDLRHGLRNMIRADIMALAALYFLTYFEFLFPQPDFAHKCAPYAANAAVLVTAWGFAGLAIGRHIRNVHRHPFTELFTTTVPASWMIFLLWLCFAIGVAHMLIAVDFNIIELFRQLMGPRFSQEWQRGKFGDWKALLTELGLFLYLIPPLCGIIMAQRNRYSASQLISSAILFTFVMFQGFVGGTRNIFASYLATFLIAYAFAATERRRKEVVILAGLCAAILVFASSVMLQFRTVGFLNYLQNADYRAENTRQSIYIDYNLYAIAQIVEAFPRRHDFLGWEVPYLALIRPIPRAIWPGKPEGISYSIEDVMGIEGITIAATFIGESYMAWGVPAVFVTGLLFGFLLGWWGRLASPENSDFGILIYSSGFFAAVISMRSLYVFTTALLPTLAAIVLGTWLAKKLRERRARERIGIGLPQHDRPHTPTSRPCP
jgi:oligosaccharide repeat unit polymerase